MAGIPQVTWPDFDDQRLRYPASRYRDDFRLVPSVRNSAQNGCVVHKRRNAREKTTHGRAYLGRTLDGVPQEAGEQVAKRLRREECLRSASALLL
jgi:hypothetical protein